ncbi:MAG: precorrin-2 dehydrogenase/sirohydrochlorin ferrochelatase family protein [Acidimicrobiales bacterium]
MSAKPPARGPGADSLPVPETLYPVNLDLAGRSCVVIGGGAVAARKVAGLLEAGASVTVVAPSIGPEVEALVDALAVTCLRRRYRPDDLDGVWLAITATSDPAVNAAVHADAQAARVWVNAADDPPACSFVLPAVVRQGPVMVTVSTAGRSPALATWLKAHVAGELGPEFAVFAGLLAEARASLQAAGRSTEEVDWRPVLDWEMLDLIKAGHTARARERLQACLS